MMSAQTWPGLQWQAVPKQELPVQKAPPRPVASSWQRKRALAAAK